MAKGNDTGKKNKVKPTIDLSHGSLQVSSDGHFLMHRDGTPFFYLGDTAWELFHRLSREEAEIYLENRREKEFTVIQAVLLAELNGLNIPNVYGHTPLVELDPEKKDESYAFIYIPSGKPVLVCMSKVKAEKVIASWYNPRKGNFEKIGEYSNTGIREFVPPTQGRGEDWVLVLDDASMNYCVK